MKRPSRDDFCSLINGNADREEIIKVTSRCGRGIPEYIADVIEAVMTDSGKNHSIQVLNDGVLPSFPDSVMLQMTCQLGYEKLKRPKIRKLPEFFTVCLLPGYYRMIWQHVPLQTRMRS